MCLFNKKEFLNRLFFKKVELKKIIYKSLLANSFLEKKIKIYLYTIFLKFDKRSSISYFRNFCLITN